MSMIIPTAKSFAREVNEMGASGLNAGLKALADMKLKELQQNRQANRMAPFFEQYGINPAAGYLPQQAQSQLLRRQPIRQQQPPTGWQNDLSSIMQMLSGQFSQGDNLQDDYSQQEINPPGDNPQDDMTNPLNDMANQGIKFARKRWGRKKRASLKPAKKLTTRIVDHYLSRANYDPEKAKEMAEQAGYGV